MIRLLSNPISHTGERVSLVGAMISVTVAWIRSLGPLISSTEAR